jgi:glycosyltransferase 2 family protein
MAAEPVTAKWLKAIVISAVLAAASYLAAVLWVGRVEVGAALKLIEADTLLALLALSSLNYGLRFARWHYYLRALGSGISIRNDLRIYLGGFALTTTPGKAGEMARSLWLRPYGVPAAASLAAFLAERLQDFLAIALLSSLGASLYRGAHWLLTASFALVVAAIIVLQGAAIVEPVLRWLAGRRGRLVNAVRRLSEILLLARGCLTPVRFAFGLLTGLLAWGAEALALYVLLQVLGHPLPPPTAVSIYALSMLAGALSFMPGGLGGSEATMIVLLRMFGAPLPIAVSATLIIRLTTLWFAVLLGIAALSIRTKAPPLVAGRAAATPSETL